LRRNVVLSVLGNLLFYLAAAPLPPRVLGLIRWEQGWWGFLAASLVALTGAFACRLLFRKPEDFEHVEAPEGFAIVTFGWLLTGLIGAIPYVLLPDFYPAFADAVFESFSGFTTTGATVLSGPEISNLPQSFHLWRAMTHWIGGMGILVMVLAVLPTLGAGGIRACRAEPGLVAEKLTPRIRDTVLLFVKIYAVLTIVAMLLLWAFGGEKMTFFKAVCHALSALATGGFSTEPESIAGFGSVTVEIIIMICMVAAAMNYVFYYFVFVRRTPREALSHTEPRAYLTFLLICIVIVWFSVYMASRETRSWYDALRGAAFQVCAIGTTTGFATEDYSKWPPLACFVILILMFTGGGAGSTGGGRKIGRLVLLFRAAVREIRRVAMPRRVVAVKFDGRAVGDEEVERAAGFFLLYIMVAVIATALIAALGDLDFTTATSSAIAALGSIGPGFGEVVGPAGHYGGLPGAVKCILSGVMVLGRLEIYAVLVLFMPRTWR